MRPSKLNIVLAMGAGLAVFAPVYFGITWWSNLIAQTQETHGISLVWLNLAAYSSWAVAGFVAAAFSRGWRLSVAIGTGVLCTLLVFVFYSFTGFPSFISSLYESWYLWFGNGVIFSLAGALLYQGACRLCNVPLSRASTGRGEISGPAKPGWRRDRAN